MATVEEEGYTYRHPRPMVTVDAVVFRRSAAGIEILLIRRGKPPFGEMYALPGGFVDMEEDLPDAAARELEEETGLKGIALSQIGAFGAPGRDPRGRNISIAFLGWARGEGGDVRGGDDADEARWFPVADLPPLAFDHGVIMEAALAAAGEGG